MTVEGPEVAVSSESPVGPPKASGPGIGRSARKRIPRSAQAVWEPAPDRAGPLEVLSEQDRTRVPELVPVRYGRMLASSFTFYRGAAAIMAADLASQPDSGLRVQLCGDAHLSNFGVFPGAGPAASSSTSTTSTRRLRDRSSGTSSGSPPA